MREGEMGENRERIRATDREGGEPLHGRCSIKEDSVREQGRGHATGSIA